MDGQAAAAGGRPVASAEIWYLYHSGFAVKTRVSAHMPPREHFLVFDYYADEPAVSGPGAGGRSLDTGVIEPAQIAGERVTVFASHRHPDHYNPVIWRFADAIPSLQYLLSGDIRRTRSAKEACAAGDKNVRYIRPGEALDLDGLRVTALDSTDIGIAFLVKDGPLTIFHAGDLNWWHWEGEPEAENRKMARDFCAQIDRLRGERIDLAFFPVDPRLGGDCVRGIDYFMRTVGAAAVFPMHFGDDTGVIGRLKRDPRTAAYRDRIMEIHRRGERFSLTF